MFELQNSEVAQPKRPIDLQKLLINYNEIDCVFWENWVVENWELQEIKTTQF